VQNISYRIRKGYNNKKVAVVVAEATGVAVAVVVTSD
jgi:hypothetical protein